MVCRSSRGENVNDLVRSNLVKSECWKRRAYPNLGLYKHIKAKEFFLCF